MRLFIVGALVDLTLDALAQLLGGAIARLSRQRLSHACTRRLQLAFSECLLGCSDLLSGALMPLDLQARLVHQRTARQQRRRALQGRASSSIVPSGQRLIDPPQLGLRRRLPQPQQGHPRRAFQGIALHVRLQLGDSAIDIASRQQRLHRCHRIGRGAGRQQQPRTQHQKRSDSHGHGRAIVSD